MDKPTTEELLNELEMWEGRKELAEEHIQHIRIQLGVLASKNGIIVVRGGQWAQ